MLTLQHLVQNGKSIAFVGIVGKAGPCETPYGMAIDVADNSVWPCRWILVIPDNPDIVSNLSRGDVVQIDGTILKDGKRPLVFGRASIRAR